MARRLPLQFQLLIKPAGSRCNLHCKYCFYYNNDRYFDPPSRGRGKVMSLDTLEAMTRELLSYRMPQTVFAWQGGEPTLAGLDFFRKAVAFQQRYGAGFGTPSEFADANLAFRRQGAYRPEYFDQPYPTTGYTLLS